MKKILVFLFVLLFDSCLFSQQEPSIKIYMNDGSALIHNISDIEKIGILKSESISSFTVHKKVQSMSWSYDFSQIEEIRFGDNNQIIFVLKNTTIVQDIFDIDSIVFKEIQVPRVDSLNPKSAYIGDMIKISGIRFGKSQDSSRVNFNGIKANEYNSWTDNEINVKVPVDAISGKVSVIVKGVKSNEIDFTLLIPIPDEVKIGEQTWMTRNLNVTKYRNGDLIPEVRDSINWVNLKTGAWCYYNNDSALGAIYGKLYNWYAVNDMRGLAPEGWHVGSDYEWTSLVEYLGGENIAGGKLKEAGTTHWLSPNFGATNESGFTALPGGWRGYSGSTIFLNIGLYGRWWTSTKLNNSYAMYRDIGYNYTDVTRLEDNNNCAYSVRCVKDK